MFEIIQTPFAPVKTVRLASDEEFRPCATGLDMNNLQLRTRMEALEIQHAHSIDIDRQEAIATAANTDKTSSVQHALWEAIERISLAGWWALDRPFAGKIITDQVDQMLNEDGVHVPEGYIFNVGFVPSIDPALAVACSILTNKYIYPFAVLGGGCDEDKTKAAKSSVYESIQSWAATNWLDNNTSADKKAYWDTKELVRRAGCLQEMTFRAVGDKLDAHGIEMGSAALKSLRSETVKEQDVYITDIFTNVNQDAGPLTQLKMAELVATDSENISIFTPHNI